MRLLVIDGNSIANRAFYGIKLLTTKDGRYTNAIFGFLNIMNSLLRECEPDEVAVAFDLKHPTFRHEMYDGYKGTRHAMPDELAQQMPILKELLTDLATARYRQRLGGRRHSGHAGCCLRGPQGRLLSGHGRPRQPAAGERNHHCAAGHQRYGPQQNGDHGSGCHPRKVRH